MSRRFIPCRSRCLAALAALALFLPGTPRASGFEKLALDAAALRAASNAVPAPSPAIGSRPPSKWYGTDSRKARMKFRAYILYPVPANYPHPTARLIYDMDHRLIISERLGQQLRHMYGAFTTHPGFAGRPGIPSNNYSVELLAAEEIPGSSYAKITYSYEDLVVFSSRLFNGAGAVDITFVLPAEPSGIYDKGMDAARTKNLCTDDHYNTEGDFWYFWNPYKQNCPIRAEDLVQVQARLETVPMTVSTYPEYDLLYGDNGNGDTLQVSYLVGVDHGFEDGDLGKTTFDNSAAALKAAGFKMLKDNGERKTLAFRHAHGTTKVEMLLLDPHSQTFAQEAVRAMKTADIFLYDGHSGLGGFLYPGRLERDSGEALALPLNKYQIFFFRGCSTYAYYNGDFFKLKKGENDPEGTKYLDIVTTGIGALFASGSKVDLAFLTGAAMGARPSWQELMDGINAADLPRSALNHVNGDEDNPATPGGAK